MSANAQPASCGVVLVDNFHVRHESLNTNEVRRVLKTQVQHNITIIITIKSTKNLKYLSGSLTWSIGQQEVICLLNQPSLPGLTP